MTRRPDLQDLQRGIAEFRRAKDVGTGDAASAYEQRVARNLEDIVHREIEHGESARAASHARLASLLGCAGTFEELEAELLRRIVERKIDESHPVLMAHLRAAVMAQIAIDSPRYWSYLASQQRRPR
jgi:hypothetical protein